MSAKSDLKRKLILDAAIRVFADHGYQYAKIDDIAEEAGIAKGSIHAYFENKLDVLLSIMLLFLENINGLIFKKISRIDDPIESLKAIFRTFQDILLHDQQSLCWGKILQEGLPKIHTVKSKKLQMKITDIYRKRDQLMQALDNIIIRGHELGVIKKNVNPQILRQILGGSSQFLVYGLFMQFSQGKGIGYDRQNAKDAMNILIDAFSV